MTSLFCVDFPPLRIIEQHVEGLLDWSEYWKLSRAFGRTYLCDVYSHVVLCDWCSDWGIRSRVERTLNLAIIPGECVCVCFGTFIIRQDCYGRTVIDIHSYSCVQKIFSLSFHVERSVPVKIICTDYASPAHCVSTSK